jgi:predicted transcriptional regulator
VVVGEILGMLALPVTALSWAIVGVAVMVDRNGRSAMKKAGVDGEVYDILVKMRGAKSRLAILRSLDKPRHRSELAGITGLDWKEVDRDLELLEKYGIVALFAESGAIKIYGLTQQGRLLVDLLTEMLKD